MCIRDRINEAEKILTEKHNGLFKNLLDDYRDRVKIFGTHFATLDVRQDSRVHQQIIDEIVSKKSGKNAENLLTDEKLKWLMETETVVIPEEFEGITKDTLHNVLKIKNIQKKNGERGLHRYIISVSYTHLDVYKRQKASRKNFI